VYALPRQNRVVGVALALLAGVLFVHFRAPLPTNRALVGVALAAFALAAVRRVPWPLGFALGLILTTVEARTILADRLDPALAGEVVQVTGRIASVPIRDTDRVQFVFAPDPVEAHRESSAATRDPRLPGRIRLDWYAARRGHGAPPELAAGQRWRLSVKPRAPRGLANPGGFDAEQRSAIDRIGATGYVHDETEPVRLERHDGFVIERARGAIAAAIAQAVGESDSGGLVQALAVGVQDAVPDEQWTLFRLTGITHLVAISGLHVTLFALVVASAVRQAFRLPPFGRIVRWRVPAEVGLGLSAALGYSLLAGWSVPTQRTVLMLAVYGIARLARRDISPATLLSAALVAVLLHDPLAALTAGFWLSFGAVGSILAVSVGPLRAPGTVRTFVITQGAVTVALAPVLAAMFGGLTWAGTVANVVAIPAYSFVAVPLVLGGTAVWPVWPAAASLAWRGAAAFLDLQWMPLAWLAALPGVGWSPVPPGLGWLALGAAGALLALAPVSWAWRTLATVLVVAMLAGRGERPWPGHAWVTVLDVGQGLAVAVETHTRLLLYDTGPSYRGGGSAGQRVIVPWLRHRGWTSVHRLVISHGDNDHAGGAADVLAAVPAGAVVSGEHGVERPCRAGTRWAWDGVQFDFLHPDDAAYGDNDGSCVLRVTAGRHRALLTGDITAAVEGLLPPDDVAADVVTVPHHGSRTSSSEGFVAAVGARWAAVGAAHANRWNFPRADVVARWEGAGATVVVTARDGAVQYRLGGRTLLAPPGWRRAHARWWNAEP
jgi:competence protein ComEC